MLVPDEVIKSVAFIGIKDTDGRYHPKGTAFFVSRGEPSARVSFSYLVTAKHVIDSIKKTLVDKVHLRVNLRGKGSSFFEIETNIGDWFFHPEDSSVDVAALAFSGKNAPTLGFLDIMTIPTAMFF